MCVFGVTFIYWILLLLLRGHEMGIKEAQGDLKWIGSTDGYVPFFAQELSPFLLAGGTLESCLIFKLNVDWYYHQKKKKTEVALHLFIIIHMFSFCCSVGQIFLYCFQLMWCSRQKKEATLLARHIHTHKERRKKKQLRESPGKLGAWPHTKDN